MQQTRRQVLDALADGPVAGPELATRLDISRAAVWKHVEALREDGFDIESRNNGYVLVDVPEFGGAAVEHQLDASVDIEYHDRIASTNDRARELAADGAEGVCVLADEQTGARGRLDRPWESPAGGVWLSLVYRPDLPPSQVPVYTLAAAVAATAALREVGVSAEIKWPNDILVDGEKLVGILTEMEGEADRVSWVVVGIGINANIDAASVPDHATTVKEQVGDIDRGALTASIIDRLEALRNAPEDVPEAWRELSTTIGQIVRVETPGETVTGEAVGIEFPGTLVVETDDGKRRIAAGDCEHLRPA
ncbi:HTH domain protein / biotin--[acetyl-CoA-carboxylase] ligase [Natronomonas pharaonis DSM 2160]|uniref:HTH domain protein / biotin--[acetyl-CoA-carboxylase] ligase n=1 Tax=Natronomonas pharaonis (strain ATCC 35678 / DSM 2160 / CIP 103997 / JCM 8858 / NBRC 14720 / NCIMB 2260 / Gabara) TaxID=348780 RepID=A0A1U7EYF7_NATPD|nr:biotin--[acetyl-CoA-carboxylase] ligase [Natronomonas pharaonis]CAI50280.1 HTH domain protein / biotin--[acetyl-CoA-carboxylase] ligase [Natronomonas pharaonis DSM 2160]